MHVPKLVFKGLKQSKSLCKYTAIWFLITIMQIVEQTLMANILSSQSEKNTIISSQVITEVNSFSNEVSQDRIFLVIMILLVPLLRFGLFGNMINSISTKVLLSIWTDVLIEYSNLTMDSQGTFSIRELERKMRGVEWGFSFWIDSGFPSIINIISMSYLCIYTFYLSGSWLLFIGLVAGVSIMYFFVKRKLDKRMHDTWNKNDTKYDKLNQKLILNLPRFAYGSRELSHIISLMTEHYMIKEKFDKSRNEQKIFTGILNQVCVAMILLLAPNKSIVSLLAVTLQFTSTVNNLFGLINTNVHCEEKWTAIRKKFNKSFKKDGEPEQIILDSTVTIKKYSINKKDFELKMNNPLNLSIGKTIIITGPSGAGKTTFLKGIFGFDDKAQVVLSNGKSPRSYAKNISLMYQSIKEDLQFDNLSMREIFDNSDDEQLITEVLQVACVGNWIERLQKLFQNINKKEDGKNEEEIEDDKEENEYKSWLDIPLNKIGQISGGEKTRLAIAIQIFELIKYNKKILVLDEPEQGSDPPIAYKLIKQIIDKYGNNCLIIIISHLEKYLYSSKSLNKSTDCNIKWNYHIKVENGLVDVMQLN